MIIIIIINYHFYHYDHHHLLRISIGKGNITVEFFSADTEFKVWIFQIKKKICFVIDFVFAFANVFVVVFSFAFVFVIVFEENLQVSQLESC